MPATPTGIERVVAVQDLFFSTTDRKGTIDGSNAVFCHYAQYSMAELLGAPHNIIRHPGMPAGVFHAMWDLLLSGRPMAGYVANLASDGATYWVFATITPLGDGFLSVRQRPCQTDLFRTAVELYDQVRPAELAAREAGASRVQAAEQGAQMINDAVVGLGFADYSDFIRTAVPAEITARRGQTTWTGRDPRDPGYGLTQDLVDAAIAVDTALDHQMLGLDELEALSAALAEASADAIASIDRLTAAVDSAVAASQEVSETQPVLGKVVKPISESSLWLHNAFDQVGGPLDEVRGRVGDLRLRTALARLHDETLAEFAREMAAGDAPERAPLYMEELCRALTETATAVGDETHLTHDSLLRLAGTLDEIQERMREFQRLLATWRLLIPRYGLSQRLDPFTRPIDQQLAAGLTHLVRVRQLSTKCVAAARPIDPKPLADAVSAIDRARLALAAHSGEPAVSG